MKRVRKKQRRPGPTKKAPVKKLSPRQKRACEAFVGEAGGQKKKALELAGYPASVAATKQGREWTADMQAYVRELMDREGITDALLVQKHKSLLEARTVFMGEVTTAPDNTVQGQMLKLAYEVKGMLKPTVNVELVADQISQQFVEVVELYVPAEKRAEIYNRLGRAFAGGTGGADAATGR
jgi:hypothetical protein